MNRFTNLTAFASIGTALALAAIAPLPASAAGANKPPPPDDILRGPIVSDEAPRSLVSRDMAGRFVRVEGRPEEAAVPLLVLEPGAREAAMRVFDARFEAIREHVIDQIDLLREASDAVRSGDSKRADELQREMFRRFKGADERTPLIAPLAEVLPAAATAELTRMVDEYWAEWLDAESAEQPGRPREAIEARLKFQLFQGELSEVHAAILQPLQQKLDRIYEITEVTDTQRSAIRNAVIACVKESRLRPTGEARLALARAILAELSPEQREKVFAAALGAL